MEADKLQTKHYQKCCLPQCSGYRFELHHKFPKNLERCKLWLQAFDQPKLNEIPFFRLKLKFICSRHFRVEDYVHKESRKLNFVAVPNLNLKELNELDKCRQSKMESTRNSRLDNDNMVEEGKTEYVSDSADVAVNKINTNYGKEMCTVDYTLTDIPKAEAKEACPDIAEDFRFLIKNNFMLISDAASNLNLKVDILWLRSLCRCSQCFDKTEGITVNNFFELPNDLQPVMATVVDKTRRMDITWSDNHNSTYNLNELYGKFDTKKQQRLPMHLPWTYEKTQYREDLQPINFFDLIQMNNNVIYNALNCLQKSGVLIVKYLPKNDKDSLLKRSIVTKLFNHLFDNLTTEKRNSFPAHETIPNTNCTFESMDKGLQILSVPYYKENSKVKLILVDGFQAIDQLPATSYNYLKKFRANYSFKDNNEFEYKVNNAVIEEVDDALKRVWFAPSHLHDLQSEEFAQASKHFKILADNMKLQQNQWLVELNNETLVILDNYRICWCLEKPLDDNEIDCLYMERKHYLSSLKVHFGNDIFND